MSISSSSNTTTSSSTSPESVVEHVAIVTSLILDKDKSIDDDEEDQTGAIEHSKLDHQDEHHYQTIKRTKVGDDDNDGDNNMQQANLMRCHNKNSSNYNDLSSNELKSVPSIIRVSPLQKSQPAKAASQSPGVVQIPSQTPRSTSSGNNSTTFTTTIANATNSSSLLQEVASISSGSSSNNVSQNNLIKQSNTVVKIETSPTTTSDISPKKVAQTSKKSPPTRPDLVASSKLTLHGDQQPLGGSSKTRPLLMNYNHHNHYYQLQHNTNHLTAAASTATAAAVINADGKNVSLYKYDANKSLATNVSSQLILSSIIAGNPGQRATQQLGVSGNLTGLQFCLTAPSQQTTASKYTTSRNLIETHPTTITNATTIASKPSTTTTTTTTTTLSSSSSAAAAAAYADAIETKPSLDSLQATARSKVKGYHLSGIGNDCSQVGSDNLTQSPGSSGGASGAAGNAVAARLIDLGKKLLEATKVGNVDQVRQLVVESGAPFTSDWLGTTALHIAAQNGFTEIAEILIRGGVNRDARTKLERTALHLAAQSGSLEIVDSLITRGADVNGCDMLKMTPLHWAVERGHVCVVERLLIGGADLKMKSKFQLTPVDMAKNSGFYDILELFKTWTSGCKDEENLEAYRSLDASFNESEDFLDIDYHLALVDSATNSRGDSMLDNDEPCLDLVGFEWNKFEIDPELFLPNEGEDDTKVEYLTKIVEELQRENQQLRQQLRQRVEQLNEKPVM